MAWNFQVANDAIQYLGQGDSLTQTYAVSVNDGHGGVASQNVAITINGTNDAPEIVAGDTSGQVFEDGSRHDSGQLVAVDVDQHSTLTWSASGAGPMTPRADYRFLLDNLNIVRNGTQFFNDDFGNGTPPPAGPTALPTPATSPWARFLESGGRTIMDGSLGVLSSIVPPGTPTG